jgi:hypothetical protein
LLSRHLNHFRVTLPLPTRNNLSLPYFPLSALPIPIVSLPYFLPSSPKTFSCLSYQHPNGSPKPPSFTPSPSYMLCRLLFTPFPPPFITGLILGTLSALGTRQSSELMRCCVSRLGMVRSVTAAFFLSSLLLCVSHLCRQYIGLLGIDVCGGITLAEYLADCSVRSPNELHGGRPIPFPCFMHILRLASAFLHFTHLDFFRMPGCGRFICLVGCPRCRAQAPVPRRRHYPK